MAIRIFLTTVLLLLGAGCSTLTIGAPPSSPQPVQVAISHSLEPLWREKLSDCAGKSSGMALVLEVLPASSLHQSGAEIVIQMGEPEEGISGPMFQLGWQKDEELVRQPVLAITDAEPQGPVKNFLICMQNPQE